MAGETQLTFASVGASIPPVKQGRLRALAVSGLKRSLALPEVPSLSEAGVKGYDATSWYGMLAPSATPPAVITRIGQEAVKALADAQLRERLLAQGIEPATGGVEEFAGYFDAEVLKWAKVIKDAAIPPQ
jgi:tripartite-type tricarboxylate transporter receptor subunit TctC